MNVYFVPTAKEWIDELRGTAGLIEPSVAAIEARERDIRLDERRKTLVDGTKVECEHCSDGLTLDAMETSPRLHGPYLCTANGLHDLIATIDAERKIKHESGCD